MTKRQRRKGRKRQKPGGSPLPAAELKAASRAQLGRDADRREYRPRADDASVEDPLHDWPEDS